MSEKVKGVKIRFENGNLSQEIPIGALAQNVDYNEQNVKQTLDRIDLSDRIKKGTGANSIIFNGNNIASGNLSHAEGGNTTASFTYSHAQGTQTTASQTASHAEGASTVASGQYSHAEGSATQ